MPELRTVNAAAVAFLLMLVLFLTVYFGAYFALSVKHSGATADEGTYRGPDRTTLGE